MNPGGFALAGGCASMKPGEVCYIKDMRFSNGDAGQMKEGTEWYGLGLLDINSEEYWSAQNIDLSQESLLSADIFACIASTEITNPEAFEAIKKSFPKTYEVYRNMIDDMLLSIKP